MNASYSLVWSALARHRVLDVRGLLALVLAFALLAFLWIVLAWFGGEAVMAAVAAAPASQGRIWGRKREPAKTITNVAASSTAELKLPRYPRTVLGILLEKNFADSNLTRIEGFIGEKSIWGPLSAAELRMVDKYINANTASGLDAGEDPQSGFLYVDFTSPNVKDYGGEFISGLDLSRYPNADVRFEFALGATGSPSLKGHMIWGPPQVASDPLSGMMRKLVKRTYPQQPAGDFYPSVDLRGAIMLREFWKGIVYTNAVSTAFTAANHGTVNTGNGTCTATVSSLTPVGRYTVECVEPGANVGTFLVRRPDGKPDGTVVTGAGAVTLPSGLVVTIADGATDFIVGDGFYLDVLPENTDGNLREIEIKKNEDFWYFRTSRAAMLEQRRYGRRPMAGLLVADFLTDNRFDSVIDTAGSVLDHRLYITAQDTPYVIHEVLAAPTLF